MKKSIELLAESGLVLTKDAQGKLTGGIVDIITAVHNVNGDSVNSGSCSNYEQCGSASNKLSCQNEGTCFASSN